MGARNLPHPGPLALMSSNRRSLSTSFSRGAHSAGCVLMHYPGGSALGHSRLTSLLLLEVTTSRCQVLMASKRPKLLYSLRDFGIPPVSGAYNWLLILLTSEHPVGRDYQEGAGPRSIFLRMTCFLQPVVIFHSPIASQ